MDMWPIPPRPPGEDSSLAKYLGHLRLMFLTADKFEFLEARAERFQ
jgi:hypothetical protein